VGPTEQALADHSHGGVVGLVFGAFGECSQSVDLLVESFGKLVGEQGYAEMGYRTPEVGVGVATWDQRCCRVALACGLVVVSCGSCGAYM
jgi:hypothetical protein